MAPIRFGSVSASMVGVVVERSPIRMSRVVVVDDGDGWCIMMGMIFCIWMSGKLMMAKILFFMLVEAHSSLLLL